MKGDGDLGIFGHYYGGGPMQSQAYVNKVLIDLGGTKTNEVLSYVFGIVLLGALAQIAIPLPWTPVPVTGQTFGVTLIALLWGQKRAFGIVAAYLIAGVVGLPVFAIAGGATWGYLVGMLLSTLVIGYLSDRGWGRSIFKAYFAGFLGSCVTLSCGVLVLSFFIPNEEVFVAGLLPFLPGDFIKTVLAAGIASSLSKTR